LLAKSGIIIAAFDRQSIRFKKLFEKKWMPRSSPGMTGLELQLIPANLTFCPWSSAS
jgi:hypothetical protein